MGVLRKLQEGSEAGGCSDGGTGCGDLDLDFPVVCVRRSRGWPTRWPELKESQMKLGVARGRCLPDDCVLGTADKEPGEDGQQC